MPSFRARVVILFVAAMATQPTGVFGQGVGIGPRLSLVRGDVPTATASTRFVGGLVRMRASKRVVLEAAMDYRTERSEDGLSRVIERPLQGSILLFPVRSTFAPYVLAGYGVYQRTVEVLDVTGAPAARLSDRETGAHVGFGAELFVGRHAAFVLDYRYRFVRLGSPEGDETPVGLPGLDGRLSHRGAMWTSGVAFYF